MPAVKLSRDQPIAKSALRDAALALSTLLAIALAWAAWHVAGSSSLEAGRPVADPQPALRQPTLSSPSVSPSSVPASPPGSKPTPSQPTSAPAAGSAIGAASGPGITDPGIRVVARPDASGVIEVIELVRVPSAISQVTLTAPNMAGAPLPALLRPTVADLQVVADGNVVAVPYQGTVRDSVEVRLLQPAVTLQLRYRLIGAVERSQPAPPGRALLVLAPLTATMLSVQPVVMLVTGARVSNLTCPLLSSEGQLCGRQDAQAWSTTPLRGDTALVIAQVDLPAPA